MATRLGGALAPFEPSKMQWISYSERIEEYLVANSVDNSRKKVAILLSSIGDATYELLGDLCAPDKPNTKTFEELVGKLTEHFQPTPTVISEHYKFHLRSQQIGETAIEYIAALRRLAKNYAFGDFLNDALRDKFVCGLASESIRKELLKDKKLTLETACETATAMEVAATDSSLMGQTCTQRDPLRVHCLHRRRESQSLTKSKVHVKQEKRCYRCTKAGHTPDECKFKNAQCYGCGKNGHIKEACRSKPRKIKQVEEDIEVSENEIFLELNGLRKQRDARQKKALIEVIINSQPVNMEVDTGAAVTVISEKTCRVKVQPTKTKLKSVAGQTMPLVGEAIVQAEIGGIKRKLKLFVARGNCPSLFGRDWIQVFYGDNWAGRLTQVNVLEMTQKSNQLQVLLEKYDQTVFRPELGELREIKAKLKLKPNAQPKFCKPHPVPYAVKVKLGETLERMVMEGNLEKIDYSEWATPIVAVMKPDGSVRVCGDYEVTLNPCLEVNQHPLPRIEDCFQTMNGGKKFTKLDLAQAYNQVQLEEASRELTVINTHKGLYRWKRLPYGVASSPAIFQEIMDKIFHGLSHVVWYLDDILVSGTTEQEHLKNLEEVFKQLEKYGLRVRKSKCTFFQDSVEYLGHVIDKEGVRSVKEKIEAIVAAKSPVNTEQLQSFLGMVNYYGKFISNLSTIAAPLNQLRRKDVPWKWTKKEEGAYQRLKEQLSSAKVLIHYNPKLPLKLDCDASSVGIGAVLSHITETGEEKPIAYASRSLTKVERNYSQIEREALSIVWGIKKFNLYLCLNKFILVTDHKPLTTLFNPDKPLPVLASGRIQGWAIFLMNYQFIIQFRPTNKHTNVDALSRLPLDNQELVSTNNVSILQLQKFQEIRVTVMQVASERIHYYQKFYTM